LIVQNFVTNSGYEVAVTQCSAMARSDHMCQEHMNTWHHTWSKVACQVPCCQLCHGDYSSWQVAWSIGRLKISTFSTLD